MSESTSSSDSGSGRESRRQSKKRTYGSKKPKRSKQRKQKGAGNRRSSVSTSDSDSGNLTDTFNSTDDDPAHSRLAVSLQQLKELLTSSRNLPKKAKRPKGKRGKGKQKGRRQSQSRSYKRRKTRKSKKKRKYKKILKISQKMRAVELSPISGETSSLKSCLKGASIQSTRPKSVTFNLAPVSARPSGQSPPSTETFSPAPSPAAAQAVSKVEPTPPLAPASNLASGASLQAVSHALPLNAQPSRGQVYPPEQVSNNVPVESSSVFSSPVRIQSETSNSSSSGEPASSTSSSSSASGTSSTLSSHLDSPVRIIPDDAPPPSPPRSFIGKGSTTSKMAASTCRRPPFGAPKRLPASSGAANSSRTPLLRIAGTPPVRSGKTILPPPAAGVKVTRPVDPVPQSAPGGTGPASAQGDKSQNKG